MPVVRDPAVQILWRIKVEALRNLLIRSTSKSLANQPEISHIAWVGLILYTHLGRRRGPLGLGRSTPAPRLLSSKLWPILTAPCRPRLPGSPGSVAREVTLKI